MTGNPMRPASLNASSMVFSKPVPGTSGTPQAMACSRAVCFNPKDRICCGVGPMKARPADSQASAKVAFSLSKP